jgi:hypothetical protein
MKKYYYSLVAIALVAIVALPAITTAEEGTSINIREKLRQELELKNQNAKINQSYRNDILERQRKMASSTASSTDKMLKKDIKGLKGDLKDIKGDFKDGVKDIKSDAKDIAKDFIKENKDALRNASTTLKNKEIRKEIELRLFEMQKNALIRQLNLAIDNLKQIRARIQSRIVKAEQSGRNLTEAKNLLVIADAKINTAQTAINTLANLTVATSSTITASTTATTTVKLDKPRKLGENAIKAVKDAREALNKVVVSIAKNMGLGNKTATSTPSTNATTTATTTASTTTQ